MKSCLSLTGRSEPRRRGRAVDSRVNSCGILVVDFKSIAARRPPLRNPRDFGKPLCVGAPTPVLDIPFRPSRMIHFFDPSNEKIVGKLEGIAEKADIVLGNLEDAIPVDNKEAARAGLIDVGKEKDLGTAQLWTRVNALDSPWVLDDLTQLVTEIGDKLDVIMVPKVEGAWDIHYVDRLLAQLESKAGLKNPL